MVKIRSFTEKYVKQFAIVVLVATVVATAFISHYRVNSYSIGYEEAIILGQLGIFTGYEEGIDDTEFRDFLQSKASVNTAILSFKRMQGAYNINGVDGSILNEDDMFLYYKYLDIDAVPDLMPAGKDAEDRISAREAYYMAMRALGYSEYDYSGFASDESDGLLEFLQYLQFGFTLPVDEVEELTNGELACIIYETFYAIPDGADIQVYRIRANINSDFKRLLLEHGLYDDIPVTYVPLFVNGVYAQDTFFAFMGENAEGTLPKNEWGATYSYASQMDADDYIELLKTNGYTVDSQYNMEHTDDFGMTYNYIITLMYKAVSCPYKGENIEMTAYCVLKYDIDNDTLEWNLLI